MMLPVKRLTKESLLGLNGEMDFAVVAVRLPVSCVDGRVTKGQDCNTGPFYKARRGTDSAGEVEERPRPTQTSL